MAPSRWSFLAILLLFFNECHTIISPKFFLPDDIKERLANALKAKPVLLNGILLTVDNFGETLTSLSKVPKGLIEVLRPIFAPIRNETMEQKDCGILNFYCQLKKIMDWG